MTSFLDSTIKAIKMMPHKIATRLITAVGKDFWSPRPLNRASSV
jgi:hypothetical protein